MVNFDPAPRGGFGPLGEWVCVPRADRGKERGGARTEADYVATINATGINVARDLTIWPIHKLNMDYVIITGYIPNRYPAYPE